MRSSLLTLPGASTVLPSPTATADLKPWLVDRKATASRCTLKMPFHDRIVIHGEDGWQGNLCNGNDLPAPDTARIPEGQRQPGYPDHDQAQAFPLTSRVRRNDFYTSIYPVAHAINWKIQTRHALYAAPSRSTAPDVDGPRLAPLASRKNNEDTWRLIVHPHIGDLGATAPGVLAGTTHQAKGQSPKTVNLDICPTIFPIGPDSRAKPVRPGCSVPASRAFLARSLQMLSRTQRSCCLK